MLPPVELDDELFVDQSDDCSRFQALVRFEVLARSLAVERERLRWDPEEESPTQEDEDRELVVPSATLNQFY